MISNLEELKTYVIKSIDLYLKENLNELEDINELEKEKKRREYLRTHLKNAKFGDDKDKEYIKEYIKTLITTNNNFLKENVCINNNNIKDFIDLDSNRIGRYLIYLIVLYVYKKDFGYKAFTKMIEDNDLFKLRMVDSSKGYYVDEKDIFNIYSKILSKNDERFFNSYGFNYEMHLDILVQLIYEETYGNSNIDELMHQDIDDIGIGLSGLQSETIPRYYKQDKRFCYEGVWIKYKGSLIDLRFLSLQSFKNLKNIVKESVSYNQKGQFSKSQGFLLSRGKDGSRRMACIDPFAENSALWIRKFTAKNMDFDSMLGDYKNTSLVKQIAQIFIKSGASLPICGYQGVGKTSTLESLAEFIQPFYAIRVIESSFESNLRHKYPNKNILTVQEYGDVDLERAYEFSLKTTGDIYIVQEASSDSMVVDITRTANRGGRSVIFTYHPNSPKKCILEIANALLRKGIYKDLRDSLYTALNTVNICLQIEMDMESKQRYYNFYEFIPINDYKDFKVVPIIEFDLDKKEYVFRNKISKEFYKELYRKSPLDEDRKLLKEIFCTDEFGE